MEGLFNPAGWEKGKQAMPEISLKFRNLKEKAPREVTALIVRGMVHLWQEQHGKPSRKGYYNREWAQKMESVGLTPSSTGAARGKQTGYGIKHYIEPGGPFERAYEEMPTEYLWPFMPQLRTRGTGAGRRVKVTYTCEGCGAKVWGKAGLGMVCQCGDSFVAEGEDTRPELWEQICQARAAKHGEASAVLGG